jgi:hypothetical protein
MVEGMNLFTAHCMHLQNYHNELPCTI